MTATPFRLGDHEFLPENAPAPLSRMEQPPRQILGAPPPSFLEGIARESTDASPAAAELREGRCCGHGEPTFTVFDVVIDGSDVVEVSAIADPDDPDRQRNLIAFAARNPAGGPWHVLFRREWEQRQMLLDGIGPETLSDEEAAQLEEDSAHAHVSIGFEYICDATSRDCVGWMAIDLYCEEEDGRGCVVDAELA